LALTLANYDLVITILKSRGGRETLKEHREKGADLTIDMSYQYLRYFEMDEQKLEHITEEYGSGRMLTSEIKNILSEKVIEFVINHQQKRSSLTDEDVKHFYDIKKF